MAVQLVILWSQTLSEMKRIVSIFITYIQITFSWYCLCKCKLEGATLSDSWVSGSHGVDGHDLVRHNCLIFSPIFSPASTTLQCPMARAKLLSYSSKVATVFRKAPFFFIGKICLSALESGFWFDFGWFGFTCREKVSWSNGQWFRADTIWTRRKWLNMKWILAMGYLIWKGQLFRSDWTLVSKNELSSHLHIAE